MLATLRDLQRKLNPQPKTTPVLPQAPAGHFWRVTNRLWSWGTMTEDPHYYESEDSFEVQLHKELPPTRLRKREQSTVVASSRVIPAHRDNQGLTLNQMTIAAAERVLAEINAQTKLYTAIKQIVGDYR
jgi:hypothetical protein